jgi:hypothetical protein
MRFGGRKPNIRVLSINNQNFTGDPTGRASRRASAFRHRAAQLLQEAVSSRFSASERRYLLDLAAVFQNVADAIEPPPSKIFGE